MWKIVLPILLAATTPDQAWKDLMNGNGRARDGRFEHNDPIKEERLEAIHAKQEPFAVVVACADSRVSPEILFDQGVGDLFVVRVAGNVVGPLELESIFYAVMVLKAPLIVVMGHENCGAVDAVFKGNDKAIPEIAEIIRPAIKNSDSLQSAVEANVREVVKALLRETFIKEAVDQGKLEVIGTCYHFQSGVVTPIK